MSNHTDQGRIVLNAKRLTYILFGIFIYLCIPLLTFVWGFNVAINEHSGIASSTLRKFLNVNEYLYNQDISMETIERKFLISSVDDSGKETVIQNSITYPHSWHFHIIEVNEEKDSQILSNKIYKITSPDNKMILTIKPSEINTVLNILAVETIFKQEITKRCLDSYSVSSQSGEKLVSIYRETEDDKNFKYVQEVANPIDNTEGSHIVDDFVVFNRSFADQGIPHTVWIAEVSAKYTGEKDQIIDYVNTVDSIVSSLQIKE